MPRSSIIGSGDNLGSIGEEAADEGQFILSRAAASSAQLSTSQPALGKYSSAIDPDSGYGFNTASGPIPPLSRNLSNLQISPGLQQDDSPSYGITTPSMANNAGIPTGSSNLQQNAQEEDDYSDDDTAATSPKSFRMQEMVNSAGIPIRGSNPQRNEWEKDDYYDDDTVATSVPKPFTYSMPPPASTHPLSTSYSQTGPLNIAYPPYISPVPDVPPMAMSPLSERAPTMESNQHIMGLATVAEDSMSPKEAALHGNFRVHPAKDFVFGRVFKILWIEPKGQGMPTKRTEVVPTLFGEDSLASIRRFVIFHPMQGHCLCLPILTYKRQGTAKSGVKAQDHAIIYTEVRKGEKPKETKDEEKLLKKAIRMEPKTHRDQLNPLSRLNYAKIYTVEYNVKVCFIGKIHKSSLRYFARDYNRTHTLLLGSGPDSGVENEDPGEGFSITKKRPKTKPVQYQNTVAVQSPSKNLRSATEIVNRLDVVPEPSPETGLPPENKHLAPTDPNQDGFKTLVSKSPSSSVNSDDGSSLITNSDRASSATSVDADPLVTLLSEDQRLSTLFSKARRIIPPDRFESNMRQLLLKFAKSLRVEANSNIERKASRVIKYQSRNIASALGKRIYPIRALNLDDPLFKQPLDFERWREAIKPGEPDDMDAASANTEGDEDSDIDDSEADEEAREDGNLQLHLLESFIKPSKALFSLGEDFKKFLEASEAKFGTVRGTSFQEDSDWTEEDLPDTSFRTSRRAIFDPIHKALSKLWPESKGYSSTASVDYKVFWDVPQFLARYFAKGQRLGNVLTLTGDANEAQALTCSEYLKKTWPGISGPLFDAMEELILTSTEGCADTTNVKITARFAPTLSSTSTTRDSLAIFAVDAKFDDHHDIVSAISWVCAAVRHGETEGLSVSKVYTESKLISDDIPKLLIKLCPLTSVDDNGACWHSLFTHTVIAYDFPISRRKKGRGLELSFQNMLIMARSLRLIEYDNGLIAEGLDNLTIPVAEIPEDDALQWHLEWKMPSVSASDILAGDSFPNRYKIENLQKLAATRAFLGWTENAFVMLGTERFNKCFPIESVGRSAAPTLRNVGFRTVSHNITLGTNAIPGLVLQGQTTMAQSFDGNYTATRTYDKRFHDRLQDSAKRSVIIANWTGGTSWYLPETSVILYMIHLYIISRGYTVLQSETESASLDPSSVFANEDADGGQAARKTLKNCMKLRLSIEDTSFTMDQLIGKFLLELELERQELHQVLKTARELKKVAPDSIVGYELLDVVLEKPNLLAKVIRLCDSQPWTFLAEEAPVLIVENLGQAIVTNEPQNLCDRWKQVPAGRNYLVAAAPAIQYLIESRGGFQLSNEVLWDISDSLIKSHTMGVESTVLHTQTLRSIEQRLVAWKKDQIDPRPMLDISRNGAFIFGPPILKKGCTATLPNTSTQMSVEIHAGEDENQEEITTAASVAAQISSPA